MITETLHAYSVLFVRDHGKCAGDGPGSDTPAPSCGIRLSFRARQPLLVSSGETGRTLEQNPTLFLLLSRI
jgi:hypothetical protein